MKEKLEAVLFLFGGHIKKTKLMVLLNTSFESLNLLVEDLKKDRKDSGIIILSDDHSVSLKTNPEFSNFIEKIVKSEQDSPLSKASQETLSIIAYTGPINKYSLDLLRGVNTHFILQKLLIKELIISKTINNEKFYSISVEFLAHMNLTSIGRLENYEKRREKLLSAVELINKKMKEDV